MDIPEDGYTVNEVELNWQVLTGEDQVAFQLSFKVGADSGLFETNRTKWNAIVDNLITDIGDSIDSVSGVSGHTFQKSFFGSKSVS